MTTGYASQIFATPTTQQPAQFITTSQTITIAIAGIYRVSAMGGGGSGGVAIVSSGGCNASGGGGGGFTEIDQYFPSGAQIVCTVGAGGSGVAAVMQHSYTGNPGGATTATCSQVGLSLTANGGGAGAGNATGTVAVGGAGGTASGGVNNQTGGAGGSSTCSIASTTNGAGGGGAPGTPYGTGGAGGSVLCSLASSGGYILGGGGAVGGFAGSSVSQTTSGGSFVGGGGGTGSSGAVLTNTNNVGAAGSNKLGLASTASIDGVSRIGASTSSAGLGFETLFDPWRSLTGGGAAAINGGSSISNTSPGTGGGGGAFGAVTGDFSLASTLLGGTGGVQLSTNPAPWGAPVFGGGTGGWTQYSGINATTPMAGNGVITIQRIG